ncbi:MAG: 1-aminocyclopropane-1-carboxylate deaminase/D-cysteine desulfhydrase [Cyclobacteriaceae bacterium]
MQKIPSDTLERKGIELYLKRDDLIHSEISGNKWRKLKYNLIEARKQDYTKILTFGGAFSNHILACAAAAQSYEFQSVGIIRGEELTAQSNPTLSRASELGMSFEFVSRSEYKLRNDKKYIGSLQKKYPAHFLIPEGGTNELAVKGCSEITEEVDIDFDWIVTAVGTGGTLAGISAALKNGQQALGIPVLKGAEYIENEVNGLLESFSPTVDKKWQLNHGYHLGGYAKYNDRLIEFINKFKADYGTALDPIYTGKMMMAIYDLAEKDFFDRGSTVVALHTGGLQGIDGFNERHGNLIR